jgi:hypothetical protein
MLDFHTSSWNACRPRLLPDAVPDPGQLSRLPAGGQYTIRHISGVRVSELPSLPGPNSLSRTSKVIGRFPQNAGIVLDRHTLGSIGEQNALNIAGTNKCKRKLDELARKCSELVQGNVHDEPQNSFRPVLGEAARRTGENPPDADRHSLLVVSPPGLEQFHNNCEPRRLHLQPSPAQNTEGTELSIAPAG